MEPSKNAKEHPSDNPKEELRPTGGGFGQTGATAHPANEVPDPDPNQATLDDALRETFPASDPISPGDAAVASGHGADADSHPREEAPTPPDALERTPQREPFEFPTLEKMKSAKATGTENADSSPSGAQAGDDRTHGNQQAQENG